MAAGIVFGLMATQWLRRIATAQPLPLDVTTHAVPTIVVTVGVVSVAAIIAAYLPARHASRVDPEVVLRSE